MEASVMSWENDENVERICPKTGRCVGPGRKRRLASWKLPLVGLVSLLWFLVRVIPKPSRVAYPCQRAAFPLASGFVVWLTGAVVSRMACRKAKSLADRGRYVAAGLFAALAVAVIWWAINTTGATDARAAFVPIDPPNSPIGVGKGIHPGRVVWVHDPSATTWDGVTGFWWDDRNLNQQAVDNMVASALRTLSGQQDDAAAWHAVFRYFNRTHGAGDVGYKPGEKIAIKINLNPEGYGPAYNTGGGNGRMPSPQMIHSLLAQLFNKVHVSGADVTIYDASRAIADPLYSRIHGDADPNFQNVRFVANSTGNGRVGAVYDPAYPVHFANPSVSPANSATAYLPTCVTEAKYLINIAPLSGHSMFGFTASGKNWFGSICWRNGGWTPSPLHNFGLRNNPMGSYNPIVDLIGHPQLGGKTLLFLVDGLYGSDNAITRVIRFSSFGNNWTASVFASQDSIAIDSVMLDFLRNEPLLNTNCSGQGVDNYLHEAALARNPPSGSFYDPGSTGSRLASLGVHEHWNNAVDKQYSRNLGQNEGIELVTPASPLEFALPEGGAISIATAGIGPATQVGYAAAKISTGTSPYGVAVFSYKQYGVTVSEAGISASPPTTQARIFIDYRFAVAAVPAHIEAGTIDVNTGIAVVNYGSATANVTYTLRNASGTIITTGHGTIDTGYHFACFIDQLKDKANAPDFNLPSNFQTAIQFGSLEIVSTQPVSVLALRGTMNQRNEFLITTTPVADLTQILGSGSAYFPQFADGGGYTTSLILLNISNTRETGKLEIRDKDGNPLMVNQVGGTRDSSFNYSIEPGSFVRFQSDGFPANTTTGWVQVTPDAGTSTPVGSGIFAYNPENVLVSESGIPATAATTHARVYVDLSGNHNTGLAIVNVSNTSSTITINAYQKDGVTAAGIGKPPIPLAANGHTAAFADEFVTGLSAEFTGVLDIRSTMPFAALTLRSLVNGRNEFLMTTFPFADVNQAAPSPVVFPQIVDGGGYITEIILLSSGQAASATLNYYDENGMPTNFGKPR
jgi:hypothetical protein